MHLTAKRIQLTTPYPALLLSHNPVCISNELTNAHVHELFIALVCMKHPRRVRLVGFDTAHVMWRHIPQLLDQRVNVANEARSQRAVFWGRFSFWFRRYQILHETKRECTHTSCHKVIFGRVQYGDAMGMHCIMCYGSEFVQIRRVRIVWTGTRCQPHSDRNTESRTKSSPDIVLRLATKLCCTCNTGG